MKPEVFVGVDICKPRLDVIILPTSEILTFENTPKGITQFVKYIKKQTPTLVSTQADSSSPYYWLVAKPTYR